jgi:hypothetical protein
MSIKRFLYGSWKDLLIGTIFISLSAVLSASMDTIDHHWKQSIFSKMGSYFHQDWTRVYERDEDGDLIIPLQRKQWNLVLFNMDIHPLFFDAWHLFKSTLILMIIMFGSTFIFARERRTFFWKRLEDWYLLLMIIILYSIMWILIFNLFYDHLLLL